MRSGTAARWYTRCCFSGLSRVLIILDRAVAYYRCLRLPAALADLVETYGFSWDELDRQLAALAPVNVYRRFFEVIGDNRNQARVVGRIARRR